MRVVQEVRIWSVINKLKKTCEGRKQGRIEEGRDLIVYGCAEHLYKFTYCVNACMCIELCVSLEYLDNRKFYGVEIRSVYSLMAVVGAVTCLRLSG